MSRQRLNLFSSILILLTFTISYGFTFHSIKIPKLDTDPIKNVEKDSKSVVEISIPKSRRLPNTSYPISYEIELTTNIHKRERIFSGVVHIIVETVEDTNEIVLHAGNLTILKFNIANNENGESLTNINYEHNKKMELLTITSNEILPAKNLYKISISYQGFHYKYPNSFYISEYKDLDGLQKWVAATQFEYSSARNTFPCYDEPSFKARFKISIAHSEDFTTHSNMPLEGEPETIGDGMVISKFPETIKMPPYLVAFTVTDFHLLSDTINNVTHEVLVPRLKTTEPIGEFALSSSMNLLGALEEYFGIEYPLPKLTHIGLPTHITTGMENYGLITYPFGQVLSLSNLSKVEMAEKYYVIAHEMTHQWLGDLVTTRWWDTIWLNEATSTHFGLKIANYTMGQIFDFYFLDQIEICTFSSKESFPISYYVEKANDIADKSDPILYYKGAYILHMFENALTENVMRKSFKNFFKQNRFSNVGEDDLFVELQAVATELQIPFYAKPGSVKKAFSTWLHEKGYPILYVNRSYETESFTVLQKPFVYGDNTTDLTGRVWHVPITYTTESEKDFENMKLEFISDTDTLIEINPNSKNKHLPVSSNEWLILNKKKIAPVRINYDERNWRLIVNSLHKDPESIHPMNKVQLIRDASYFAKNNELDPKIYIDLLLYLKKENGPEAWHRGITELFNEISDEEEEIENVTLEFRKDFILNLIDEFFEKIMHKPTDDESLLWEVVRANLFELASRVEYEGCKRVEKECEEYQASKNETKQMKILKDYTTDGLSEKYTYPCVF